jgi:hypothetical protein
MTQQTNAFFTLFWIVGILWIVGLFAVSVIYRRMTRKPVLFFTVPKAIFIRHTASGFCLDKWWRRLGGASNCLVVAISQQRLIIRPLTPFNLMFMPEFYGLEYDVPLNKIVTVSPYRYFSRSGLRVVLRDAEGACHGIVLFLQMPQEFLKHLPADCITA